MPDLFDEVNEAIDKKTAEEEGKGSRKEGTEEGGGERKPNLSGNRIHTYSEEFEKQYGKRKT